MDFKHTSGQWKAVKNSSWGEHHKETFGEREGYVICHRDNGQLIPIISIIGMPFRLQEEINSNAALIAAAPRLLSELKKLCDKISILLLYIILNNI